MINNPVDKKLRDWETTDIGQVGGTGVALANNTVYQAAADGQVVVVAWQGMEYTGEIGNSAFNLFPGDGGTEHGAAADDHPGKKDQHSRI